MSFAPDAVSAPLPDHSAPVHGHTRRALTRLATSPEVWLDCVGLAVVSTKDDLTSSPTHMVLAALLLLSIAYLVLRAFTESPTKVRLRSIHSRSMRTMALVLLTKPRARRAVWSAVNTSSDSLNARVRAHNAIATNPHHSRQSVAAMTDQQLEYLICDIQAFDAAVVAARDALHARHRA